MNNAAQKKMCTQMPLVVEYQAWQKENQNKKLEEFKGITVPIL